MKKYSFLLCLAAMLLFTSCATILSGSKAKVTVKNDDVTTAVTLSYDDKVENHVFLPHTIKIKRGYKPTTITAKADGYEDGSVLIKKGFNPTTLWNLLLGGVIGGSIDAATGALMKPNQKEVIIPMKPNNFFDSAWETEKTTPQKPVIQERVTRDNPGNTSLERTIVRCFFDSDPQGARIFWRVISSVPDEVKNTNELWLGSTPFEETRSFNIQGLTYENSQDVQIEIKVRCKGYVEQSKRFNVRQAIDQQEISSFFDMVKER